MSVQEKLLNVLISADNLTQEVVDKLVSANIAQEGVTRLATIAEGQAGISETIAVTPKGAKDALANIESQIVGLDVKDKLARKMAALAYIQWMRTSSDPAGVYSEAVSDDFHAASLVAANATYDGANHLYSIPAPSKAIFDATGADQTYTVPAGISKIRVKMWGAGGGRGGGNSYGGGGGYVEGDLNVTPGEILTLIVGNGGPRGSTTMTYGGGGYPCGGNGAGGGRSGIRRGSSELVTVGAGGGGGSGSQGGAGGGLVAGVGGNSSEGTGGGGGTQSVGGAGGSGGSNYTASGLAGSLYMGAYAPGVPGVLSSCTSSGGGGGYYGGGSGGGSATGGGGGSSYVGGLLGTVVNTQASGGTAANNNDSDRGTAATGAYTSGNETGSDGRIVIMPYGLAGSAASVTSPTYTLPRPATDITAYVIVNDLEVVSEGADRLFEVSCDGGSNWVAATADTSRGSFGASEKLIIYEADVSAHTGTNFKWRLSAPTGKQMEIKLIAAFAAS